MASPTPKPGSLCLQCGICCDGTLFNAVELQPGDSATRLTALGLRLRKSGAKDRFQQPCSALKGCRCDIYRDRPTYCRQFRCRVLIQLGDGEISFDTALRLVRSARRKAAKISALMSELGEDDESLSLRVRHRRLSHHFERHPASREDAERFGELSQQVHELNLVLSRRFYAG